MEDDVELPPTKASRKHADADWPLPPCPQKRTLEIDAPSSDPPIFSSDDLPAGVENYSSVRTKRQRKGPWWADSGQWEMQNSGAKRRKKGLTRNLDSGVFMGSEDTESSLEDVQELRNMPVSLSAEAAAEKAATDIVDKCMEDGAEIVDLAHLGLRTVPPAILENLRNLTKLPAEVEYHVKRFISRFGGKFEPDLALHLSANKLQHVPLALFRLVRLSFLSLRNNELKSLPPFIDRLYVLHSINIGGNQITYLPSGLLTLIWGNLKVVHLFPNPFIELDIPVSLIAPAPTNERQERATAKGFFARGFEMGGTPDSYVFLQEFRWIPSCLGRGSVSFLSQAGQYFHDSRGFVETPCHSPKKASVSQAKIVPPGPAYLNTRAPSLFELALRKYCKLTDSEAKDLHQNLTDDPPHRIQRLLEETLLIKNLGPRKCPVCGSEYIIARSEWIEWWDCIPPQVLTKPGPISRRKILPVLRQGCSWKCVPTYDVTMRYFT